jgi:hypothetical protein
MRLGTVSAALLVALLLAPSSALAQYSAQQALENPDYYVTAYYNFNLGGDLFKGLDASSLKKSNAHGLGASFTFLARHLVSAELDFNYSHNFFGSSDTLSRNNVMTTTVDGIVGPWFRTGFGRIRPYAVAGGGYMRGLVSNRRKVGWTDPGKNLALAEAGGGLLWLFNDSLGVRADVRYRWGFGAKEDAGDYGYFDKWTYMKTTVGFSIAF